MFILLGAITSACPKACSPETQGDTDSTSGIHVTGIGRQQSRGAGSLEAVTYLNGQGGQNEEDRGARGDTVGAKTYHGFQNDANLCSHLWVYESVRGDLFSVAVVAT